MLFRQSETLNPRANPGPNSKQRSLLADIQNPEDVFSLKGVVGGSGDNRPDDIAKTQLLLAGLGYQDLRNTNGPTGDLTLKLDDGIKRFQRDNRLKVDGEIGPRGETIAAVRRQVAEASPQAPQTEDNPEGRNESPPKGNVRPLTPEEREELKDYLKTDPWYIQFFRAITGIINKLNPKEPPKGAPGGIRG